MNKCFQLIRLLTIPVFLYTPFGLAQDKEPVSTPPMEAEVEETAPENTAKNVGQEVEINEDNYRQFMELRDARGQRNIIPENAFKPRSGSQKLDKLPEESRKHLRNQLREIIVQGDQWQPGDEANDYPYVPSVAASTKPSLEKQEAEAWGELIGSYHQREAEIYENSSRSQAAMASQGTSGGESTGSAKSGGGSAEQGAEGQQTKQESHAEQSGSAGSYSPDSENDPNTQSTVGISQNAMEFLLGKRKQSVSAGQSDKDSPGGDVENSNDTNPLPELPSLTEPIPENTEGILTIEDLLKAQGIRSATGIDSSSGIAIEYKDPDKNKSEKDGAY